jgi:ABC-type anion transport system duplicated permease subunit
MQTVIKVLIGLAALTLIMAVIGTMSGGWFMGFASEGLSRGSNNLALIAIALSLLPGVKKS